MKPTRLLCCLTAVTCFVGAASARDAGPRGPRASRPPRTGGVLVAHVHAPAIPELKPAEVERRYRIRLESAPARPVAGQEARLSVFVADAVGKPVTTLEVHHERLAHFIVVSANLEEFQHLHAEDFGLLTADAKSQGRFTFPVTFAHGGGYALAVDFVDQGKAVHQTLRLEVDGPPQPATVWRLSRDRTVDGLDVRLFLSPDNPEAETAAEGILAVSAAGAPVKDLGPYLGAPAHLAIFGEGASSAAHLHGEAGTGHDHAQGGPVSAPSALGPNVSFGYAFPTEGRYRLFAQFARGGKVLTVPFDVEVGAAGGAR